MLTNSAAATAKVDTTTQKVVIVDGTTEILELLETVLDAGHYDVVFVESGEHAYSQVKRVRPNLVVLCIRMDEMEGFRVLSMLKLDGDTREIPVLTYATELEGEQPADGASDASDEDFSASRLAFSMN
jgi:CheY-like chemotaxis protein